MCGKVWYTGHLPPTDQPFCFVPFGATFGLTMFACKECAPNHPVVVTYNCDHCGREVMIPEYPLDDHRKSFRCDRCRVFFAKVEREERERVLVEKARERVKKGDA